MARIWNEFKKNLLLAAAHSFEPQSSDPSGGDTSRYHLWVDSQTVKFGKPTLKFSSLNLASINDVSCNALHVDPTAATGASPYAYTAPNNSWLFVDSNHAPTMPEVRVIDQTTEVFYRIQVSNGTLRAIIDSDQTITY